MPDRQEQQAGGQSIGLDRDAFKELLFKEAKIETRPDRQKEADTALEYIAIAVTKDEALISDDILETIDAIRAGIDRLLTAQVNQILHHADFQRLEGSWRGLAHLVNNTETDEQLIIRVFNVSKKELGKELKKFEGTRWDQSPLFKKVYEGGFGILGGKPYGCLVGDYHFDHNPQDVKLLGEMAKIAAASHAPFIAGAAPSLFGMESWQELTNPRDLTQIMRSDDYAPWKSLRDIEDSRYIGLAMPRFLSRLPYSSKSNPVEGFAFEEDTSGGDHSKFTWSNSAFAMAVNINRAFKETGWCTTIRGVESGGLVSGLPVHTFPSSDGGVDMKCPTEIGIGDRREAELSKLGLMPLLHRQGTDMAAFIGAQSLQKPAEYDKAVASANAQLSARLPYLFAACRFGHYLKAIVRDKIGGFRERADMETWLNNWIGQYVLPNPAVSNDMDKARRPLAAAQVLVTEDESNPGYYRAVFHLRPHYQLEGLDVSLSLVSRLPVPK